MLGVENISGRDKRIIDFWQDIRDYVRMTLIDLSIFLETSGGSNIEQVITQEKLKPIVETLLWNPVLDYDKPNLRIAQIAQIFIEIGFNSLRLMKKDQINLSNHNTIDEAIDLSRYLVESLKPESERRYSTPKMGSYV